MRNKLWIVSLALGFASFSMPHVSHATDYWKKVKEAGKSAAKSTGTIVQAAADVNAQRKGVYIPR